MSFNGNKIITTGGGGAILTNDEQLANYAKYLTTNAKAPHCWDYVHDEIAYNFRMPNPNAALDCAQLEKLSAFVSSKRSLFDRYRECFKGLSGVSLFSEPANCVSNFCLQTLMLSSDKQDQRDGILEAANSDGLSTRPAWRLLHTLAPYRDCPTGPLPIAGSLSQRIINIPSDPRLA